MDVPALLKEARHRGGWTQVELAREARVSRTMLREYEAGTRSPTVATLDALLAACTLQLRGELEPLMADLDEQLDLMLAGPVELDLERLTKVADLLDDLPGAKSVPFGKQPHREGPVTWAFDDQTALALHGLGAETFHTCLVVVFDDAARWWLRGIGARGTAANGTAFTSWLEADEDEVKACTRFPLVTFTGSFRIRVAEVLPRVTPLQPDGCTRAFPVLPLDEVERAYPRVAALLARWRSRS